MGAVEVGESEHVGLYAREDVAAPENWIGKRVRPRSGELEGERCRSGDEWPGRIEGPLSIDIFACGQGQVRAE